MKKKMRKEIRKKIRNHNKNSIIKRLNFNKKYRMPNLNENGSNDNNLNSNPQNYSNKSKYLNETINRGMLAESICISEDKKNLKIKNSNNKFSKTCLFAFSSKISKKVFKPIKITLNNTNEKNYLNTPLNKEENDKKQIIQRYNKKSNNKIFNKKKKILKSKII